MGKIVGEEKHYQKLNLRLSQELNIKTFSCINLEKENRELETKIKELQKEISTLEAENKILKDNSNLSDDEIKQMLKSQKATESLVSLLKFAKGGLW